MLYISQPNCFRKGYDCRIFTIHLQDY